VSRPHRGNSAKVALFSLGVDSAKELIYSRLKIEDSGAGYCHFPIGQGYDEEYFEQLTAEKAVTRVRNSVKSRVCARYGTTTLLRSSGGVGWFSWLELFGLLPIQFLNHFRSISLNHFSHFTIIANPMRSCF